MLKLVKWYIVKNRKSTSVVYRSLVSPVTVLISVLKRSTGPAPALVTAFVEHLAPCWLFA